MIPLDDDEVKYLVVEELLKELWESLDNEGIDKNIVEVGIAYKKLKGMGLLE